MSSGLFDTRDLDSLISSHPIPFIPRSFSENVSANFNAMQLNSISISAHLDKVEAYDEILRDIEKTTGKSGDELGLRNPMLPLTGFAAIRPGIAADREQTFFAQTAKLRQDFPDLPEVNKDTVLQRASSVRTQSREAAAAVAAESAPSIRTLGAVVGGLGGAFADPPLLISMVAGAPAAAGIVRAALIESAINAGIEIPVQAAVQLGREQFGEKPDLGEAAQNVVFAAAGGALFGGLVRAAGKATKALLNSAEARPAVKDATAFLRRESEMQAENPFVAGRTEHIARYSEAQLAARNDAFPKFEPDPLIRLRTQLFSTTSLTDLPPLSAPEKGAFDLGKALSDFSVKRAVAKQELSPAPQTATGIELPVLTTAGTNQIFKTRAKAEASIARRLAAGGNPHRVEELPNGTFRLFEETQATVVRHPSGEAITFRSDRSAERFIQQQGLAGKVLPFRLGPNQKGQIVLLRNADEQTLARLERARNGLVIPPGPPDLRGVSRASLARQNFIAGQRFKERPVAQDLKEGSAAPPEQETIPGTASGIAKAKAIMAETERALSQADATITALETRVKNELVNRADEKFLFFDENGFKEIKGEDILRELDEDKKLLAAFKGCSGL